MALLPPPHHVTLPVAAVYILAAGLRELTNRNDAELDGDLDRYIRPYILIPKSYKPNPSTFPVPKPRGIRFSLIVTSIELTSGADIRKNAYSFSGVSIRFSDADGRPFASAPKKHSMSMEALYQIALHLKPPFTDCLAPAKIRASLNKGIMRSFAPLPDGYEAKFPQFEYELVSRYRQALALGILKAVLLQDNGRVALIPAHFWRSAEADEPFLDCKPITIDIDGNFVTGRPFVDIHLLRDNWQHAFGLTPARSQVADISFGPYMDLMRDVALKLGMVDGCDPAGERILMDKLKKEINDLWDERPGLPGRTPNKVDMMATLLRHPGHAAGGLKAYRTDDQNRDEH
ncbi:hypothetical protein [uncultured Methylobacterium sp.]|uniref:hypothetical protein n=1 Tax=uncultured Methylobacterium sp. TaxID=157278 RepID=UPI0025952E4F|nr:hypothetical protein [uncultured Methylobacterium sp.]